MTCPHCTAAQADPNYPIYQAGCRCCRVRSLAGSLHAFNSEREGRITPDYRAALTALLGEDWKASHTEVKQERARIAALKGTK